MQNKINILQVNSSDIIGGAAKIAYDLFKTLEKRGYQSYLAVSGKKSTEPGVILIPNNRNQGIEAWFFLSANKNLKNFPCFLSFFWYLFGALKLMRHPSKILRHFRGIEELNFPNTAQIPHLVPSFKPDIIHCHNLQEYFDLRMLSHWSEKIPVVLTLHDAWLISGHCAHSFNCERWKTGCGNCPDLSIFPAIRRDATTHNWQQKADIYRNSRLCVITSSQWLMDKINQSMLKPGIIAQKVIPHGVNQAVFHPANKKDARNALNLPIDATILLFAANGIRKNIWKDYQTLQSALTQISAMGVNVLCIALGEEAPSEHIGNVEIRFIPYQLDSKIVARFFQAADIYIHPARAEVWGLSITEALSCGTPVIASAVGGIPEQIQSGKTGFLVPEGDAAAMAEKIQILIINEELRQLMGQRAADDAALRFGLDRMVDEYLQVYREILNCNKTNNGNKV